VVVTNRNPFRVQGTLSGKKLGRKGFSAAAARRATVRLKLSMKLRARLKQKGRLSLPLTAKVTDRAGNTRTVRKVVKPKLTSKRRR
jgi:hypothetical protein